jgi:putative phage-type endonuclease
MPAPRIVGPHKLRLLQGSPEWLAARREHVTATDIPILLGLSPWKCEQDLADEKLNGTTTESTLVMRVGLALEDLILEDYAAQTGRKVRRVHGLWESSRVPWAAASPDATAAGRLIEVKWSGSRSRFASGLPEDVEAQCAWQAFVAEVDTVDVAALTVGEDHCRIFTVNADPGLQAHLVAIAADFMRRLDLARRGLPVEFTQSLESVKRKYPTDSGVILEGTPKWRALAKDLARVRAEKAAAEVEEKNLATAIRTMLGDASGVKGDGWELTCRQNAESTRTNWPAVAQGWRKLITAPEEEVEAILSIHTETVPGPRVLRTSFKGEPADD